MEGSVETSTVSPEQSGAEVTTETAPETTPEMTTETTETIESPATYADGKYQSVGELEKGYLELQSTFSKKMGAFSGAPENYEFNEGFVTEDNQGLADMLTEWGRENQMNNDGLNSLVGKYNEYQAAQKEAMIADEFSKLGENAKTRIDNARSFLEANLGEEMTQGLAANMNSAVAIEAIEKLISLTKSPQVAPTQAQAGIDAEKVKAMRFAKDEFGNRKMEDPKYREKVLALEAQLKN